MKRMLIVLVMVLGCVMRGMTQDHEFNKTLRNAEKGFSWYQYLVGTYYQEGSHGCTKDVDKALYWYIESGKNGNWDSEFNHATGAIDSLLNLFLPNSKKSNSRFPMD